jgi:carbon-monoxide dehydrogenase large subunit
VRVIKGDVGGGFGQKVYAGRDEAAVLLAARRVGRPLKWIEDRWENLIGSSSSREEMIVSRMAFDHDYRITAVHCDHQEDLGALPPSGTTLITGQISGMMYPGPYRVTHAGWRTKMLWTNTLGRLTYRGPWMVEAVAREVMVDVAAHRLGIDPLELRRRNSLSIADMPYTTATGLPYDRLSCADTLERAAELIGYDAFRVEQDRARTEGRFIGVGISHVVEPTAAGQGAIAVEAAHIRIQQDGRVDVFLGTGSHGQGTETTMAQIVATELGVRYEDVYVHDGDTDMVPFGSGSATSRTAVIAGPACHRAAIALREKILEIAAHKFEAATEDLEVSAGQVSVRGTPTKTLSVADIAHTAYNSAPQLPAGMEAGLETTVRYTKESAMTMANATHACIVEIDPRTFKVEILRYVACCDCGVIINPQIVEGQYAGGIVQGIGGVFYEHLAMDDAGNPISTSFMDYLLPTAVEVPDIEFGHVQTPAAGPGGYKGAGEGGAIASPAALINAVSDALGGIELLDQPLTPSLLFAAYRRQTRVAAQESEL